MATVDIVLGIYVLENGLNGLKSHADTVYICSAQPLDYTDASTTYKLGSYSPGAGSVFSAPSGTTIASVALSGVTGITTPGVMNYFAVTGGTDLLVTAPMPSRGVGIGPFSLGSYTVNMPGS